MKALFLWWEVNMHPPRSSARWLPLDVCAPRGRRSWQGHVFFVDLIFFTRCFPQTVFLERYLQLAFLTLACYPGMLTWPPCRQIWNIANSPYPPYPPPVQQKAFNNKEQHCRCVACGNMRSSGQMQTQVRQMNIKFQNKC